VLEYFSLKLAFKQYLANASLIQDLSKSISLKSCFNNLLLLKDLTTLRLCRL